MDCQRAATNLPWEREDRRKPKGWARRGDSTFFLSKMGFAFTQKNPRAHRNKIGTSTTPPFKKSPEPPLKGGILWAWGFSRRKNQKIAGAHKIGAATPGPRIAGGKLRRWGFFLIHSSCKKVSGITTPPAFHAHPVCAPQEGVLGKAVSGLQCIWCFSSGCCSPRNIWANTNHKLQNAEVRKELIKSQNDSFLTLLRFLDSGGQRAVGDSCWLSQECRARRAWNPSVACGSVLKQKHVGEIAPGLGVGQEVVYVCVCVFVFSPLFNPAQHINFGLSHFFQKIPPKHQNGVPKMNFPELPGLRAFVPIPILDFGVSIFSILGGKCRWYVGQRRSIVFWEEENTWIKSPVNPRTIPRSICYVF